MVLLHEFLECFFNSTYDPAISGDHGQDVGVGVEYILLLKSDTPSTYERSAMKGKLLGIIIIIIKN